MPENRLLRLTFILNIDTKILSLEQVPATMTRWRFLNHKIVFTNGCFDLIHIGHLEYLMQARALGDKLIVGLNSDNSVKRLKGANRPIKDVQNRQLLLASLQFVDGVVVFEEDTPLDLIRRIMPDILVKGGDWQPEQIVGSDIVLANGGEVLSLPFVEGYSTTKLEEKIKEDKKTEGK